MYHIKLLVTVSTILIFNANLCESHGDHGHSHEEHPSFKYSKVANEKVQVTTHPSHDHDHHHAEPPKPKYTPLDTYDLWLHAMGSTLLISAAPFFILFLVPLDSTDTEKPLLKILLAFASGGLLGDAFLHLIPHATMAVEEARPAHTHSHSHGGEEHEHAHDMSVGLWVLGGILAFLVVEKGVRIIKGTHSHIHSQDQKTDDKKSAEETDSTKSGDESNKPKESEDKCEHESNNTEIKVAGYLNLAADFSHNFTDGLAIGSSYLAGNTVGIVTTITILLHEVPHEIGDFAILLQSGVSRKNAMLLQLTTALGAVAGTAIALFAQSSAGAMAASWILPFTAGGFIYIALVSVIPELLDEEHPSISQTFLQILAMLTGVGMMILIAEYE